MRSRRLYLLFAFAVACSHEAGAAPRAGATGQPADPLAFLSKNDGQPWSADEHTRTTIAAMAAAVRDATPDPSPARTAELGKQLQELRDRLFAGCTMTGPAHDALHGYLGVLLPAVQAMTGADVAAAQQARAEVAALLPRFAEYFR
jgi:hypothetical protein